MSGLWRWILDLDTLPDDGQLSFGFNHPWPAWAWALLLILAAVIATASYRRLVGYRHARTLLAITRFVFLALLAFVLAGPALIRTREFIEPDRVLMVLDRSRSMQVADLPDAGRRRSREWQLREALASNADALAQVAAQHRLAWFGFDRGAYELPTDAGDPDRPLDDRAADRPGDETDPSAPAAPRPILDEPQGEATAMGDALAQVVQKSAGRPVSAVVLWSDGRTDDPPDRDLIRRLQAEGVPVFTIPLGSLEPVSDLAIRRVIAPGRAFTHDRVPVEVQIDRLGEASDGSGVEVELVDEATGEVLDRRRIEPGDATDTLRLAAEPSDSGEANWIVRVRSDRPDLVEDNNTAEVSLELVDRPLKVLFVEGYPRWEYRYLKNLLVRERTIDSSVMLLSADRDFAQEGNTPISRLPNSPAEFEPYDVIILGDVYADFFTPHQQEMIRNHVAERGAGLMWLAGPRWNPTTYASSPLTAVLPFTGSLAFAEATTSFLVSPTDLARRLGALPLTYGARDAWPVLSDPDTGWSALSWGWRVGTGDLKPTAEALAVGQPTDGAEAFPLVVTMRYGAGRSLWIGTDEIWRWRYGRGEDIPEQFWINMLRLLGRERVAQTGLSIAVSAEPNRVDAGQPALIDVRLVDALLLESAPAEVALEVVDEAGRTVAELTAAAQGDGSSYRATWVPERDGSYRVRVVEARLRQFDAETTLEVRRRDDELRRPEADHGLLARLADQTGGQLVPVADLSSLPDLLPNRTVRTPVEVRESLWDTPLVFGLLLGLLIVEWVGRKLLRLA